MPNLENWSQSSIVSPLYVPMKDYKIVRFEPYFPSFDLFILYFSFWHHVHISPDKILNGRKLAETVVVYHLPQIPGNPAWDVNGKQFFGSSHWKIPGTNGNPEKVVPFSRLGRSEWEFVYHLQVSWVSYHFHVVTRIQSSAARQSGNFRQMVNDTFRSFRPKIPNQNFRNFFINGKQPVYSAFRVHGVFDLDLRRANISFARQKCFYRYDSTLRERV